MLPIIQESVKDAREQSVQSTAKANGKDLSNFGVFAIAATGAIISPWWSARRDRELREFWKKSDHLSGAVYNMVSKMTAIPFSIVPEDASNMENVQRAMDITDMMKSTAQFGEGWTSFFSLFVEDLITQDNGAFAEIIGYGDPDGPIIGLPIGFAHLDSSRCQRTSDPQYPVLYHDDDGKMYKLHFTRVMYASQLPSPKRDMNKVGFCAISRCVNVAQTLIDILTYKQEKLGSRPHRAIMVTSGGLDPNDVVEAFTMAEATMDNKGLERYSKIVVTGSSSIEDAKLDIIELSKLPDGFDEKNSMELGMATVALAFGMDAQELFPVATGSSSRADALVQHLKQRGKGPGQILEIVESLFNFKYLPVGFRLSFDYQDDAQDRQAAEIRKLRSERINIEMINKVSNKRTAREQMMYAGDIDRGQFEMMELRDGRLDDGTDILNLFYRNLGPALKQYQYIGVEDPLDWAENDPDECYLAVHKNTLLLRKLIEASSGSGGSGNAVRNNAVKLLAASLKLKQVYAYISSGMKKKEQEKEQEEQNKLAMQEQQVTSQEEKRQQHQDQLDLIAAKNKPNKPAATVTKQSDMDEQKIDRLMLADEALSLLSEDAELGQGVAKGPIATNPNMPFDATGQKTGPSAGNPRAGRMMTTQDATAPSGNEQASPRDITKPRAVDHNTNAKEIDDDDKDKEPF